MKTNTIVITINKSAKNIFLFLLNPKNTPKWINSIVAEETNEWPVKHGTVYRNKDSNGTWMEYVLTEITPYVSFTLTSKDAVYHVRYSFDSINTNITTLTYHEWMEKGELLEPFEFNTLANLKQLIENNHD